MKYEDKDTEILKLMTDGLSSKQIGDKLGISHRSVERRIEVLKFSHAAKNAVQLIVVAMRKKIVQ